MDRLKANKTDLKKQLSNLQNCDSDKAEALSEMGLELADLKGQIKKQDEMILKLEVECQSIAKKKDAFIEQMAKEYHICMKDQKEKQKELEIQIENLQKSNYGGEGSDVEKLMEEKEEEIYKLISDHKSKMDEAKESFDAQLEKLQEEKEDEIYKIISRYLLRWHFCAYGTLNGILYNKRLQ